MPSMTQTARRAGKTTIQQIRQMYRSLRTKHPFLGASVIFSWARDIIKFRQEHRDLPELAGTSKTIFSIWKGISFSAKVEGDPDGILDQGKFSDDKTSPWSIKNREAWEEKKRTGRTQYLLWWNPTDPPDGDVKVWNSRKYGCSKSVAYERSLSLVKEMYKNACKNEAFVLTVKVDLEGTVLGRASLGSLDYEQVTGEDSKTTLAEQLIEALREATVTLAALTKKAETFKRTARRLL